MPTAAPRPVSDQRLLQRAVELLGTTVVTVQELTERLRGDGIELGPDGIERVEDMVNWSTRFTEIGDGRWASSEALLDGTRWTTVIDKLDAAADCLRLSPDLSLIGWLACEVPLQLADCDGGLDDGETDDGDDALVGPPGWLDEYAGRPAEVRVDGTTLHLRSSGSSLGTPQATALVRLIRDWFDAHAEREQLEDRLTGERFDLTQLGAEDLLWDTLAAHRDAYLATVVPPIDELLAAAGLQRQGVTVLRDDANAGALVRWHRRNQLASMHDLDDDDLDAADLAFGLSLLPMARGDGTLDVPEREELVAGLAAAALESPMAAKVVMAEHLARDTDPRLLVTFGARVRVLQPRERMAGLHWFEGRALDLAGDVSGAREAYERAVRDEPAHRLSLIGLAGLTADAGDAPAALRLLEQAGVPLDEDDAGGVVSADDVFLREEVEGFARQRPAAIAGRNDPCPCGSGRKYKACHLGKERHPLVDRGHWLFGKAVRYVRGHDRRLVAELAETIRVASGRDWQFTLGLIESELVVDLALHEGGLFDEFLSTRSAIVPDDEALLAASWALTDRSLFEIDEVGADRLRLRDLRSGERVTVTNTRAAAGTRRGVLLCGRPVPVADTWRAYAGFVRVPDVFRDAVLDVLDDGDAFEMASVIGRCFAPPQLRNTDGEPLRFHELTWQLADPHVASAVFDASSLDGDDTAGVHTWRLIRDSANQPNTVALTLTLTLDGETLHGEANSDARAQELLALVASLVPDAQLVDHDVRTLDELERDSSSSSVPATQNLLEDPDHAELAAAIAADLERRWLDEPVPALRGLTPRQAVADAIGRTELERLLDSLDEYDPGPGMMSATRLRAALGL